MRKVVGQWKDVQGHSRDIETSQGADHELDVLKVRNLVGHGKMGEG